MQHHLKRLQNVQAQRFGHDSSRGNLRRQPMVDKNFATHVAAGKPGMNGPGSMSHAPRRGPMFNSHINFFKY